MFTQALLDPDQMPPVGLLGPQGRPAGKRFDIYRNNVLVSLTDALEQCFPVIDRLVGNEFFRAMAREFARMHPPRTPLLGAYGAEFPYFLAGFPPVADLGYLPDVARLELAMRESYHAADANPLPAEALGRVPPQQLVLSRLKFAPSVRLLRSAWPIYAIWQANMNAGPSPEMRAEDVLIGRPNYDPRLWHLPDGGAEFVSALASGQTIGEALDAPEADFDLTAVLEVLLQAGAITDLTEVSDD